MPTMTPLNNSIGNALREAVLNLTDLDDDECADLLDTLTDSKLADERPVAALIGLAPGSDPFWSELRVGELKTLLALVIGDVDAIIEGGEWIRQFNQLDADRRRPTSHVGLGIGAESRLQPAGLNSGDGQRHLRLPGIQPQAARRSRSGPEHAEGRRAPPALEVVAGRTKHGDGVGHLGPCNERLQQAFAVAADMFP